MAQSILGLDFDIHGGGADLIFPHHENEIAQTEAGRGERLAKIWMHNGMIRFGEEKMAKSVGNLKLLCEALDEAGRDALILYLLGGHYRQPLALTEDSLPQARAAAERIRNFARSVDTDRRAADGDAQVDALRSGFFAALRDDFNTPEAIATVFELVKRANEGAVRPGAARSALAEMLWVLGLDNLLVVADTIDEQAQVLAEERERARRDRDFVRADKIRDELARRGYEIRDTQAGPHLVRRR
jgi:cysteinyl-tRNA synthetase